MTASDSGFVSDTTPPSVPSGVVANATGPSNISLTWNASSDDVAVAGYQVYRDGSSTAIATVTSGTSFQDTGLAPGSSHSYRDSAFDSSNNESAQSGAATATTASPDTIAPSVPSNLAAGASGNSINLTWSASTDNVGVVGYHVYRDARQLPLRP